MGVHDQLVLRGGGKSGAYKSVNSISLQSTNLHCGLIGSFYTYVDYLDVD